MEKPRFELVVCGGGLAGVCAALSASRLGLKTALIQDRPVLGGNSSSEIRVPLGGAANENPWMREGGILEELVLTERSQNFASRRESYINSVWDLVLYDKCRQERNLTLMLNANIRKVAKRNKTVKSVTATQSGTEKEFVISGELFVDATGDGTIAFLAGAEYRIGREGRKEFNEEFAPARPDMGIMGSSLLFQVRDIGRPVKFTPPAWAEKYPADSPVLKTREHDRMPGLWWVEVGPPYDTIADNEEIRDELLKHLLGVWDHLKNQADHGFANCALDWIGQVTGKRESRRIIGDYLLNQTDLKKGRAFPDSVAYGGGYIDLHTPGGILAKDKPPEPVYGDQREYDWRQVPVYAIPLRCLYAKGFSNLFLAGRDASFTHVALGSARLMATVAVMGQAVGTCAYLCRKYRLTPRQVGLKKISRLQQQLLKDDCYIPGVANNDPLDLARTATASATSSSGLSFPEPSVARPLAGGLGAVFPVSEKQLQTVSVFLEARADAEIVLRIHPVDRIYDFNNGRCLAVSRLKLPAGSKRWFDFKFSVDLEPHKFYLATIQGDPDVLVHGHRHLSPNVTMPGHQAVQFYDPELFLPSATAPVYKPYRRWHYLKDGWALSLRLSPGQRPYEPGNVLSGVSRPECWTNLWVSGEPLPQSLTLNFEHPVTFNSVHLIFDSNLYLTHNIGLPPLRVPGEMVRDYNLSCLDRGKRRELESCRDNFLRRRVHRWNKRVKSDNLRVECLSTWGSPSARIYEIRVYDE